MAQESLSTDIDAEFTLFFNMNICISLLSKTTNYSTGVGNQ